MKNFLLLVLIGFAHLSYGSTFVCQLKDEVRPPSWPKESLSVKTYEASPKQFKIESIIYVSQMYNGDGTFHERKELLFDSTMRLEFEVDSCSPLDRNEFLPESGEIFISSNCHVISPAFSGQITLSSNLSTEGDGALRFYFLQQGSDEIYQTFLTKACKP